MEFKHYLILGVICVLIGAGVPTLFDMLEQSENIGQKKSSNGTNKMMMMGMMQGQMGGGGGMSGGMGGVDMNQIRRMMK